MDYCALRFEIRDVRRLIGLFTTWIDLDAQYVVLDRLGIYASYENVRHVL